MLTKRIAWLLFGAVLFLTILFFMLISQPKPPPANMLQPAVISVKPAHMIIVTIPKSASVYIATKLSYGLSSPLMEVSPGYFPHDNLSYEKLQEFFEAKRAISKSHMDASLFNQQLLKRYTDRVVVQFRDPREVMLSWIHHLNRIHAERKEKYLYYIVPTPPESYYHLSLNDQIDWSIENFLPAVVTWMQGWLEFKAQEDAINGFKVLITTYDDFKHNESAFIAKILDFYTIPAQQFNFVPLKLDMDVHYRKGDQNEWRTVYTAEQLKAINAHIPNKLLYQFGWPL